MFLYRQYLLQFFYFLNRWFIFYIDLIIGSFTLFAVSWSAYQ